MASPRAIATIVKRLSPRPQELLLSPRSTSNLKSPITNTGRRLSPLNIDTPNRINILNKGLDDRKAVLGSGGYGKVYRALFKGDEVAAKVIDNKNGRDTTVASERHAADLRHSNIIRILGIEQGVAVSLITMELCGTTLENLLVDRELLKNERLNIWLSMSKALRFCHGAGVIHADIKPKNVLIDSNGQPKLTDFGCSVLVDSSNTNKTLGTPGYMAPEVVRGCTPTFASDIYSLGILAWQMLSRETPFANFHSHTILYLTGIGKTPSDNDLNDHCEGRYKELYRKMLTMQIDARPSLDYIIHTLKGILMPKQ